METITILNNKVFLILPDNPYKSKRCIGEISGDTFFTERTSKRHLLRANNSLGFNHKFIKSGNFDFVSINFDFKQIWTSRSVILRYGKFFHFSKGTLELQIFLCLRYFKECKKEAEEELRELQRAEAIQFKETMSNKLRNITGAFKIIQGGLF